MADDTVHKVTIMGSGPAGLTAAIYAARARLEPVCIEGGDITSKTDLPGGQLMLTTEVENYPGFPEGIMGPELMERFKKQAERFGTRFMGGRVVRADLSQRPFVIDVKDDLQGTEAQLRTHALIVATGASARYVGFPGEKELIGKGVTTCATCDGAFFRGKHVVVIGGGDSAMEEANFLTRFADRVTVVHRRAQFRASRIMLDRARSNEKIHWKTNRTIVGAEPDKRYLRAVRLRGTNEDEGLEELLEVGPDGGLFIAIGHTPNTDVFQGQLDVDGGGYLSVRAGTSITNVEGVFAAGDVHDSYYRQAITAAGSGCRAAIDAERWLESLHM